ncbi:MAG: hypothetical protein R3B09_26250 [Nannocystaceae bacterium]
MPDDWADDLSDDPPAAAPVEGLAPVDDFADEPPPVDLVFPSDLSDFDFDLDFDGPFAPRFARRA